MSPGITVCLPCPGHIRDRDHHLGNQVADPVRPASLEWPAPAVPEETTDDVAVQGSPTHGEGCQARRAELLSIVAGD